MTGFPTTAGTIILMIAVVTVAVAAMVRVVPDHQRLVIRRLGGRAAVRGPGPVRVLPGIDQWERVTLRLGPLETWLRAVSRDGATIQLKIVAVVSVVDTARYAARVTEPSASAELAVDAFVESRVRSYVAERDLRELADLVDEDIPMATGNGTRGHELDQWGLAVSSVRVVQGDVPLRGLRQTVHTEVTTMEIIPTTVPGTGTLHQLRTRRGHILGVLDHPSGGRTLFLYPSPPDAEDARTPDQARDPDSPDHSIFLDRDEADQFAQLLHDQPITDRLAALERRLAELTRTKQQH